MEIFFTELRANNLKTFKRFLKAKLGSDSPMVEEIHNYVNIAFFEVHFEAISEFRRRFLALRYVYQSSCNIIVTFL